VPKLKSHRGAAKRFKVTGGGKVLRGHAMANHILTKKTTKRKRNLRKRAVVSPGFARIIKKLLLA
jgi:large subunit ribosomal protein L35